MFTFLLWVIVLLIYLYYERRLPNKSISFIEFTYYILIGFVSVLATFTFYEVFTEWESFLNRVFFMFSEEFVHNYLDVGLVEEGIKLLCCLIIYFILPRNGNPLSIMIYSGLVALGFSHVENLLYGMVYGESVIISRITTSTVAHVMCGVTVGYWISLSKIEKCRIFTNNFLNGTYYTLFGLMVGTFMHGTYNYILSAVDHYALDIIIVMWLIWYNMLKTNMRKVGYKEEIYNIVE